MTEFNPSATCSKCGYGTIKSEHYDEFIPDNLHRALGYEPYSEHIERTCLVCGYTWDEAPLKPTTPVHDAVKEAVEISKPTTFDASDIEPPVIEVGDVVKSVCGNSDYCTIIGVCDGGMYSLQSTTCSWCACANHVPDELPNVSDLTLIRKAPKVHTFKGAIVHKERDGLKIFGNSDDAFNHLLGNGNKYTLTLTESA